MIRLMSLFILFLTYGVGAQNLVPNPSFEIANETISRTTITCNEFNVNIDSWVTPISTADIIIPQFSSPRFELPKPHSGNNMVGILNLFRTINDGVETKKPYCEYVGVKLKEPLITNRTYYVEYWIRKCGNKNKNLNKNDIMNPFFGIQFSLEELNKKDEISNLEQAIYGTPQITTNTELLITDNEWVKISKYFTPTKHYNYLYIGQFINQEEEPIIMEGYYLLDDVMVKEVTGYDELDNDTELPIGSIIPLNNVNFKSGSIALKDEKSNTTLKNLATYLALHPTIKISINGHTDSIGNDQSNLLLSKRRAKYIAEYITQNGVDKNRIEWKGFGKKHPIADNKTLEGRAKNRRVEFEVIE